MSILFRIVYAAHANGTHHKLALDALRHLANKDAEAWQNMFLKHSELYLKGSKAPDNEFKDFKNHVLHVRDGYWGGAPEKVRNWYGHLVEALKAEDWPQSAYAAGVLSHYYTDPIHPFHTGQTAAENDIHRAVEWSINRSYDSLRTQAERDHATLTVSVPPGATWLNEFVIAGAETSNKHYEKLIAHYDIHRGLSDPTAGLDAIARRHVSELIMYAAKGFAAILDRAIAQSGVNAPVVPLTLETLIATLKIPAKWVTKKLTDAADRRLVEAQYDELLAAGRVDKTLAEDDRMVRDLYAREIEAPRSAARAGERERRLLGPTTARPEPAGRSGSAAYPPPAAAAAHHGAAPAQTLVRTAPASAKHAEPLPETAAPSAPHPKISEPSSGGRNPPNYLAQSDNLEAAPSIGDKMAAQLAEAGLKTVGDLVAGDARAIVLKLGDRRVTAETITDWQDQARLVMAVPGLRGSNAQLLVGAGYRDAEAIRAAEPAKLCADVLAFAATPNGRRILRDAAVPDIASIKNWIENAALANAA